MDLTEAEDIKKRWQEYIGELCKKYLNDRDNHSGVTTLLEPDILKWEVKWALGSISMNKASGSNGIHVKLFQSAIPRASLAAVATGIRKCQFSFQSQRKAMPKNAQTTTQLHSSHTLVMLKILQARLQ